MILSDHIGSDMKRRYLGKTVYVALLSAPFVVHSVTFEVRSDDGGGPGLLLSGPPDRDVYLWISLVG